MPVFTDPSTFPAFHELPSASSLPSSSSLTSSSSTSPPADWFLLAQIKENMTITKTTLVVRDRAGADFAVTFDDGDHRGLLGSGNGSGEGAAPRFRKGHTLVVPRAARTDREGEGKKAVVRVPAGRSGGVRVVPGSLEQVLELGRVLVGMEEESGLAKKCAACGGPEAEGRPLMRCTGCGAAAYCSKACQVRGWGELGHKSNCKVVKSIREIWP
ncbi:hypothetical protein F4820DRAFT_108254 [Hypoxylon rubiginosum]|uniref:Uncharacterized protein n=1 Tax=Hypoxylon rubiginosum TaxID=110542 RepID=A0ACB9YMQ0_9PEZI|nr:hypothetical protein F4820DRAFT_108254 [Hypoxylon rubiginosum]